MPSKSDHKNSGLKEKIDAFHINCRKAGLRITPQRTSIYKVRPESGEHLKCAKSKGTIDFYRKFFNNTEIPD